MILLTILINPKNIALTGLHSSHSLWWIKETPFYSQLWVNGAFSPIVEWTSKLVWNILSWKSGKNLIKQAVSKLKSWISLTREESEAVSNQIDRNNPIYSILSNLEENSSYSSIIFSWIKIVNDIYWQAFTDLVLEKFKIGVQERYPFTTIVWSDYKNFVLKIANPLQSIENSDLEDLLNEIFFEEIANLRFDEIEHIKSKPNYTEARLWVMSESWKIKGKTQEDILLSLAKTRSNLERQAFWWEVLDKKELVDAEKSFLEKYSKNRTTHEVVLDERWRTTYTVENWILTKEFSVYWKPVKIRTSILWFDWINPEIISMVRKKQLPISMQLYTDIKQIIDSLIVNWEFIAPVPQNSRWIKAQNWYIVPLMELKKYKILKKQLATWKIDNPNMLEQLVSMCENTYKDSLDKNTYYSKINTPWQLFFIDIKDMWTINLRDFSNKINKYVNWEISEKQLFLESWSVMTNRFQLFIKKLKNDLEKIYPWKRAYIYIWWDETSFFVEAVEDDSETQAMINLINYNLNHTNMRWRVTNRLVKEDDTHKWWEKLVDSLDKLTLYSKIIEKRLSEIQEELWILQDFVLISEKNLRLNMLKVFDIRYDEAWEIIIVFHPPEFESIDAWRNEFRLDEIIDLRELKFRWPPSPLVNYLRDNNLSRSTINK